MVQPILQIARDGSCLARARDAPCDCLGSAKRKEFLVQSILAAEQTDRLEKSIRKVVREELQAVNITNAVPSPPPENAIPDSALDFLNSL